MNKRIPPVPRGAVMLSSAVHVAYNNTVTRFPLTTGDVMVGLGAATVTIFLVIAKQTGEDPAVLLARYRDSLKLPPQEGSGDAQGT